MSEPRDLHKLLKDAETNYQLSSISENASYYKNFRSHVIQLVDAVKKLQQENEKYKYEIDGYKTMFDELKKENKIMREALDWLSGDNEEKPYVTYYERHLDDGTIVPDFNQVAREALEKLSK